MIHFLHFHPITASAVFIFALSLWKGGVAERLGAGLMIAEWLVELGVDTVVRDELRAVAPTVVCDFVLACGLLVVALRFGKLWLGVAMILQGVVLAVHALALGYDAPGYNLYVTVLNVTTCLLLISLLTGALTSWRRRALRRRTPVVQPLQPSPAA